LTDMMLNSPGQGALSSCRRSRNIDTACQRADTL